jgi:NAD(P)-dependent dehydrogenase (short-subunit alcohol dehydrogenase family)
MNNIVSILVHQIVVITGGNTGLGLESAKRLAAAGASIVLTSRDTGKGQKAVEEVNNYLQANGGEGGKVMMANLDLCDLDNVKSFKSRVEKMIGDKKIDVLLNNAGVMAIPDRRLTKDGYEKTFQTNHLGHFALTATILPLLASNARVINVSSLGYQFAGKGLELDNLNGEKEYGPWSSYGLSKLENILFTNELQKRAQQSDKWSSLTAFSLHPGAVQTDLARYLIGEEKFNSMKENGFSSLKDKIIMESMAKFIKTVEEGASTQVYLAAASDIDSAMAGKFFDNGHVEQVRAFATDDNKAKELWNISEKLSGVQFDL